VTAQGSRSASRTPVIGRDRVAGRHRELDVAVVHGDGVRVRAAGAVPAQRRLDRVRHRVEAALPHGRQHNRPLWNVNVSSTGPDTFLGYPIYSSPDLAAIGASAKFGIFGDINRGYRIRRVNGFSLQRQTELYSNNGQVGFRGFERVDGTVVNAAAMRVLQNSAT
jgi:hypothetical protein